MTLTPNDATLVVQNRAYSTLNTHLEREIADHRAKAQEYHAAVQTLDSERAANAILTAVLEAKDRRMAELEAALRPFAIAADDLDDKHGDGSDIWEAPVAMSINAGDLRNARIILNPALPTPATPPASPTTA